MVTFGRRAPYVYSSDQTPTCSFAFLRPDIAGFDLLVPDAVLRVDEVEYEHFAADCVEHERERNFEEVDEAADLRRREEHVVDVDCCGV